MADDAILQAHLANLHPSYRIFSRIDDPAARSEASRLIDFLLAQELPVPEALDQAPDTIGHLRASLEAAHPDRKCVAFIGSHFLSWLPSLSPAVRTPFLQALPQLAPACHDLGDDGMRLVIQAANADPRKLPCIYAYAMATRDAIRAIARIAGSAPLAELQKLVAAFPVERMEESKDGMKLLPAIAAAVEASPHALPLATALTERNLSSAYTTCSTLARILPGHPHAAEFLEDFRLLVESIGIRVVGLAVNSLPGWYTSRGVEATSRFVAAAAACARSYGCLAGQEFLERKTPAARQLAP